MSGPERRVTFKGTFHALIVVAGWALFAYWWGRVIPQVDARDVTFALLFGGLTALATALVTLLWVRYNLGIFRRKGPRKRLVPIAEDCGKDALGRRIAGPGPECLRTARLVVVSVDGETKTYEAAQVAT